MFRSACVALVSCGVLLAACDPRTEPAEVAAAVEPADLVLLNGYVYTVDPARTVAQALAVRDGRITAVGSDHEIEAFRGEATEVIDLQGRMVLPGLHDVHLHLFGIVEPDVCTLRSEAMSLAEISGHAAACLERYRPGPGEWLPVDMWNFSEGNQVTDAFPHIRAALDAASVETPIILWGNDGHHGAVNSAALALAADPQGRVVGLSRDSLQAEFSDLRDLVGVDSRGEPNGAVNEQARYLMGAPPRRDPEVLGPLLPQIGEVLARNGITSVQDASLEFPFLPHLQAFERGGGMTFRFHAALRADPINYRDGLTGAIGMDGMLADLARARETFGSPLIDLSAAKIYADGVIEGNPYADPPTLPNAAVIEAYRQPLFRHDPDSGEIEVRGYVDTDSALCAETRAGEGRYDSEAAAETFRAEHGFYPGQCAISYGVLRDQEPFMHAYVRQLAEAGFTIHIHAIGDRAVQVAADALEQVTPADGSNPLRHAMAHLQIVHPDDQRRIGAMGIYFAWTFAWMIRLPEYDEKVMPFLGDVTGPDGFYDPESYAMRNSYPVRSMAQAGAVTAAGSDAPVDDRSPRPFVNMALGVTRRIPGGEPLNADETIDIHQMIAAYTINGARALKSEDETGSIVPGKRADLAVLDRNIVDLYESGDAHRVADTQVDLTVFDGRVIYRRE